MENPLSHIEWNRTVGYGKYTFTLAEIRDLLISAAVLGLIFTFSNWTWQNFFMSIGIVGPALILHELAHKFMAQKYDLVAAYVMWPTGIAIALLVAFISQGSMIFAALGAVMISPVYHTRLGYKFIGLTTSELGKISIVGPLVNLVLAVVSYLLMPFHPGFFLLSARINCWIALFNCIPIPPLDGTKIFRWNVPLWMGVFATTIVLMFLPPYIGVLLSVLISAVLIVGIFIAMQLIMPVGQQSATEFK